MAEIKQDDYVFTRAPGADTVWIQHPETGGTAELAMDAWKTGVWAGRGWEPMDEPPPEPDPTRAHMAEAEAAAKASRAAEKAAEKAAAADAPTTKKSGAAGTTSKGSE
jgi:hypothetical protein